MRDGGSIAAIIGASIALAILLFNIWRWWRRRRVRQRFASFLQVGNELQVRLNATAGNDPSFPELSAALAGWFRKVERLVEKHNRDLVPTLRSDVGIASAPRNDEHSYFVVWLPQRIKQIEKVFPQL